MTDHPNPEDSALLGRRALIETYAVLDKKKGKD